MKLSHCFTPFSAHKASKYDRYRITIGLFHDHISHKHPIGYLGEIKIAW